MEENREHGMLPRPGRETLLAGVAAILALGVFALRFPYSVGLFLPMTALAWLAFLLTGGKVRLPGDLLPFFLMALLYLVPAVIHPGGIPPLVVREASNILSISALGLLLWSLVRDRQTLSRFSLYSAGWIAVSASVTSLTGFVKFIALMKGQVIYRFWSPPEDYPWGTSLVTDYNYFAMGGLAGVIACIWLFRRYRTKYLRVTFLLLLFLNLGSVLGSGSRRGFMVLLLLAGVLLIWFLALLWRGRLARFTAVTGALAVLFTIPAGWVFSHYVFRTTVPEKQAIARNLGLDEVEMPLALARLSFRYATVFSPDIRQAAVYRHYVGEEWLNREAVKKNLYEKRREKWEYALRLFRERSFTGKAFGEGFSYISSFGGRFLGDPRLKDYPHNYVLSALLYSGLLGAALLLGYLGLVSWLYFSNIRMMSLFVPLLALTQVFAITSGNSVFSEKFTCLLLMLPLLLLKINRAEVPDR